MRCPIWGHVFGSKKSKKSDPQSRFRPNLDFQKSPFCSNNPYTLLHTLLSADNRTTRHHLCDLLLKNDDFRTKSSGGNPIWGQFFSKFSLPKTCPHHTKKTGEKNFQKFIFIKNKCRVSGLSLSFIIQLFVKCSKPPSYLLVRTQEQSTFLFLQKESNNNFNSALTSYLEPFRHREVKTDYFLFMYLFIDVGFHFCSSSF